MDFIKTPAKQKDKIVFNLGIHPFMESFVKRALGLDRAEILYSSLRAECESDSDPGDFCRRALEALGVSIELPLEKLQALRQIEGPILFAANHPFGAIDALILIVLMSEIRPQFKFVGNSILRTFPELRPVLFPVHIMGDESQPRANIAPLRHILRYLNEGGMVGLFPAGEVAAFDYWTSKKAVELPWHPHLGRLAKKSRATIVPLFFEGENSRLFQYLGLALPKLRIALLAREMLRYQRPVRFKLGAPISPSEYGTMQKAESLSHHLKEHTYGLETKPL